MFAWVESGRIWDSCRRLSRSLWEGLFFYFHLLFHTVSRSLLIPCGGSPPNSNMDTNSLATWKSRMKVSFYFVLLPDLHGHSAKVFVERRSSSEITFAKGVLRGGENPAPRVKRNSSRFTKTFFAEWLTACSSGNKLWEERAGRPAGWVIGSIDRGRRGVWWEGRQEGIFYFFCVVSLHLLGLGISSYRDSVLSLDVDYHVYFYLCFLLFACLLFVCLLVSD